MITKPNYIIIGSTGQNKGRTDFACRLIEKYSKEYFIIGVKVVAVNRNNGSCPFGGKGNNICLSHEDNFDILEETSLNSGKDTSRMLGAGAKKVYLVKVDENCLQQGLDALLKLVPQEAFVIIESNSIRKVLEPGVFIVIKNADDTAIKKSSIEVIGLANKIIEYDKLSWNFSPDRVIIKENTWIIKEKATAIVLAGGKSSRMGGVDKSLLSINGIPLIKHICNQLEGHFDQIIIGANNPDKYSFLNLDVIPDIERDKGPLMGMLSCLKASNNDVNFITACDIPQMNIILIKTMIQLSDAADIVLPLTGNDKHEPLFAVYKKSVISYAEQILNNNGRRIIDLTEYCKVKYVDFSQSDWYHNLNVKEQYTSYMQKINHRECSKELPK